MQINIDAPVVDILTKREKEALRLILSGYNNIEISNTMGLKSNTISTFKKRVLDKLCLKTEFELIIFSIKEGVLIIPFE